MSSTLILLTLNEIDGVRALLPRLPLKAVDEVLAVDGGSRDGTREFLEDAGIRVLLQRRPGRGEAFRIGVEASRGTNIVFFSPDGNEDPVDVLRLLRALEQGAEMVIASRFASGARNEEDDEWLRPRKWANQVFSWAANRLWNRGPYVTDTINGFRGIQRHVFKALAPSSTGFTIEYEMTIRAMKQGRRIVEFPTIEGARIAGMTKAPSFRTGLTFLKLFFKELFV